MFQGAAKFLESDSAVGSQERTSNSPCHVVPLLVKNLRGNRRVLRENFREKYICHHYARGDGSGIDFHLLIFIKCMKEWMLLPCCLWISLLGLLLPCLNFICTV